MATAAQEEKPKHNHDHDDSDIPKTYFGMDVQTELVPLNDVIGGFGEATINELQNVSDLSKSTLAKEVLARLSKIVGNSAIAEKILEKWQNARKEAKKEEEDKKAEAKAKGQKMRVWIKCAVCGAPFCPVAPYVWKIDFVDE